MKVTVFEVDERLKNVEKIVRENSQKTFGGRKLRANDTRRK